MGDKARTKTRRVRLVVIMNPPSPTREAARLEDRMKALAASIDMELLRWWHAQDGSAVN